MKKIKDVLIIAVFAAIVLGCGAAHLLIPDSGVSAAERRRLAQKPEISTAAIMNGEFSEDLETYLLDQFPFRDSFRTVSAITRFYLYRQLDSNGVWLRDGFVFKTEYPLNEKQVIYGADKINSVAERYLEDCNVYYSIIPDKNYFAASDNGYPSIDYDRLVELMGENVLRAEYIDIFDTLSLEDYYHTDSHWSQDRIWQVAAKLAYYMGSAENFVPFEEYDSRSLSPFYGVYMGQAALPVKPDVLSYLTSAYTESSIVSGIEGTEAATVYAPERVSGIDGYDVFLSGAQAVLTIECPNAAAQRELIIFRDSFGSSIAPLFLGAYSKITLVDLRYISSSLLADYVSFTPGSDVLFLYSTSLLNSSMLMK